MPSNDPFKILGIEKKSATSASIKKAYSIKLKSTRPDDNPEGFMELRDAYNSARNIIKWQQNDNVANHGETFDVEQPVQQQKAVKKVKYWYDEKLNFHFNSSPSGKLIEKFIRWTQERNGENPSVFFDNLISEDAFKDQADFQIVSDFIRGRIFYEAGGEDHDYYQDDNFIEHIKYKHPKWLSDKIILQINEHFSFLKDIPQNEWMARELNCIKHLFEPVLLAHSIIGVLSKPHGLVDFRAKEEQQHRKDAYGSYFDRDIKKWIDMSPVSKAMDDIDKLINIPWENVSLAAWNEIINRDGLQTIDEFQNLDARLRNLICSKTGLHDGKETPNTPEWLSKSVVILLDDTFGWNHQSGRQPWEHDQYRWLHRIIARYKEVPKQSTYYKTWEKLERNSYEFLGYQPLPWLLKARNILCLYFGYRFLQILIRVL